MKMVQGFQFQYIKPADPGWKICNKNIDFIHKKYITKIM